MEIYLFDTKKSSSPFIKAFSTRHKFKIFNSKENQTAKGKGAERFNDFSWPTWNGEIPEGTAVVFQGLVRGTKQVHEVCVRENLDWSPERNEKPLSEDLINCHAMVSFHSMSAVHAVMAGIPSYCSEHSPAYPVSMSLKELDQIEDPLYAGDRQDWVKSLMCAQFTETEMSDKKALAHLNGENKW